MSALDLLSQAAFLRQDDAPEPAHPTLEAPTSTAHDASNTHVQLELVDSSTGDIQLDPALFDAVARAGSPQSHPSDSDSSSLVSTVPANAASIPPPQPPPLLDHVVASPQASTSTAATAASQRSFDLRGFPSSSSSHRSSASWLPSEPNPSQSTLGKRSRARTSNASDASDSPFVNSSIRPSARKRTLSSSFAGYGQAAVAASSSTGMQLFTDSSGQASLTSLLGGPIGASATLPMLPPLPTLPQRNPSPPTNKFPSNKVVLPNPAALGGTKRSKRPPSWAVNEDSGLIRCVCPYTADDGFTIQCDTCNVWQHAACVIISMDDVPEEYRCERCDPLGAESRGVDRAKAQEGMRKRLETLENEAQNPSAAIANAPAGSDGVGGGGRGRGGHRGGRRVSMDPSRAPSGINALLNSLTAMTPSEQILDEFFGSKEALPPLPAMTKEEPSKPIFAVVTPAAAPTAATTGGGGGGRGKPRRSGGSMHSIHPAPTGTNATTDASMGMYEPNAAASMTEGASAPAGPSTSRPPRAAAVAAASATPSIPSTPGQVPRDAIGRKRRQMKQSGLNSASGTPIGGSTRGPRASAGSTPNVSAPPTPGVLSGPNGGYFGEPFSYVDGSSIVTPRPSTANGTKTPAANSDDEDFLSSTGGKGEENRYEAWRYEYTPIERDLIRDDTLVQRLQEIVALDATMMDGSEELETVPEELRPQLELLRERQEASRPRHGPNSKDPLVPLLYDPTPFVVLDELPDPSSVAVKVLPPSSLHLNPPAVAAYATTSSQTPTCPYPRPTMHGLFAVNAISSGSFIAPVRGQIVSLDQYRSDPINQYDTLGVPKQGVRCLPYPWSLAIDSRMFGNEIRFARSGCHPNAVVQAIKIVPAPNTGGPMQPGSPSATTTNGDSKAGAEETAAASNSIGRSTRASTPWTDQKRCSDLSTTLIFGIFATADIGRREEIVLPWDWDDSHIVHALPSLMSAPPLPSGLNERDLEPLSRKMVQVTNTILGTTHCACEKKRDCALHWMCRGAAASLPLSKAALAKPREPFAMILLNALGSGQAFQQQPNGKLAVVGAGGAGYGANTVGGDLVLGPGKPGRRMKKPDVGPLLGLVRGWIVRPAHYPTTNRYGRASSNKSSISDFPPPPPMPQSLTVYEDEDQDEERDREERESIEALSDLTHESELDSGTESELSAEEGDVEMGSVEEEEEDDENANDSFVTAHNRSMDIDNSPASIKATLNRKPDPLDGDLTDDSDLTEPLSNLSSDEFNNDIDDDQEEDEEEDEPIRVPSRKTRVIRESWPSKPEKRRPGSKRVEKQEVADKRETKKGVDKLLTRSKRGSAKEVKRKVSSSKEVERKKKDEKQDKKDKKQARQLLPSFPDEPRDQGRFAKASEPLPLFDQDVEVYSARDAPLPTEQGHLSRLPPPPPPPARWSGTSESAESTMQVDPIKEATPPPPPKEPTPPPKDPTPPPPVPRARLSLAAYRQRLAQKQTEPVTPVENAVSTPSTATVPLVSSPAVETVPLLSPAVVVRPLPEVGEAVHATEEGELNPGMSSTTGVPAAVAAAFNSLRRSLGAGEEQDAPSPTTRLPPPPPPPASYSVGNSEVAISNAPAPVFSPSLPAGAEPASTLATLAPASRPSFTSAEDILKSIGDYFSKPNAPAPAFASRSPALVAQQSLLRVAAAVSPSPPPPPPRPLAVLPSPPAPPPPYVSPPRRSPTPERPMPSWRTSIGVSSAVDPSSPVVGASGGAALGFDISTPASFESSRYSRFDVPSTTSRWGPATASSSTSGPPPPPPPPPPPLSSHRSRPSITTSAPSPPSPPQRSPSSSSNFPLSSRDAPSSSRPAPPTRPFDLDSVPTGPRAMNNNGSSSHTRGWSISPAAREAPLHPPPDAGSGSGAGSSDRRVNGPTWAATSTCSSTGDSGVPYGGGYRGRGGGGGGFNHSRGGSRGRGGQVWVPRGMRGRGRGRD